MKKYDNQTIVQKHNISNKIGTSTYIVSSSFNENSKEDVTVKIERLIKNETKNIL